MQAQNYSATCINLRVTAVPFTGDTAIQQLQLLNSLLIGTFIM